MKAYSYIRFSTPAQEEGDSLRRQISQSEAYATAHGLTLDDSLRLTDRGLSAFHGIHRIKGALGEFHRLVERGEVEPGSVLLVESLDRLSREQVLDALTQFSGLINAGVKVVTLADTMEYDRESINANFGQLLMSLVIMARAHEESKTKSYRGREAWDNKRKEARNKPLTARCPAWLKLTDGKFEVVPEVARVINRIFGMKLAGKGSERIAWELNKNGAWKPANGWRKSYIDKLLRNNRALLGEFQPHKKVEGKRTPEGEPIPGYFPPIVEPELFHQVQAGIQGNSQTKGNAGGRPGPINNLFPHIAKCARCGGPMAYVCKGRPPKGGSYLVCDKARRGLGCEKNFLRYDRFEPLILTYCKGLDPVEILPGNDRIQSELANLGNQLRAVEGELAQVERNIGNLLDNLEIGESVRDRLKARQEQKSQLEAQREALACQIDETASVAQNAEKQLRDVKDLIARMAELEGQERIDLRLSLRNQLRRLIAQMNFLPDRGQVGMLFRTGERRLLIVEGDQVRLLDVEPGARRVPAQLWRKPWV